MPPKNKKTTSGNQTSTGGANTLYGYYLGQGKKLPSIKERSKIFESNKLGMAGDYKGTYDQNVALLGALKGGKNPAIQGTGSLYATDSENSSKLDDLVSRVAGTSSVKVPGKGSFGKSDSEKDFNYDDEKDNIEDTYDSDLKRIEGEFNQYTRTLNAASSGLVASIQAKYAVRKDQMSDINKRSLASKEVIGDRSGRARYASMIQQGILTGEEQDGVRRLAELDAEEMALIVEAEMARTSKEYQAMQDKINNIDRIQEAKVDALKDLHQKALDFEEQAIARQKEELDFESTRIDAMTELAEQVSTYAYETIQGLSETQKDEFIMKLAEAKGIDEAILRSAILGKKEDTKKTKTSKKTSDDEYSSENTDFSNETNLLDKAGEDVSGEKVSGLPMSKTRARILEKAGVGNAEIIKIQTALNAGASFSEIVGAFEEAGKPLSSKAQKKIKKYLKQEEKKKKKSEKKTTGTGKK